MRPPPVAVPVYIPPTVHKGPLISTSSTTLLISCLFDNSYKQIQKALGGKKETIQANSLQTGEKQPLAKQNKTQQNRTKQNKAKQGKTFFFIERSLPGS